MIAIWILLGIAVLFGGGIFAVVMFAIRHDASAALTPTDTEVGRFSRREDATAVTEMAGVPPDRGVEVDR